MAAARGNFGVAVLDGKLYAVGGYGGDILSSVERYDPALDAWEEVAPMASAREAHTMAVLDGKLYAVGGFGDWNLSSVERYDPATNAWEAVAPMAEARGTVGVAVLDGKLYAAGGMLREAENEEEEDVPINRVERFDSSTNAWEEVAPMATARHSAHAGNARACPHLPI